jgi:hypothetical protein
MTSPPSLQIDERPGSVEAFLALRDRLAGTPQGGAALMIVALLLHVEDVELGQSCLALAVDESRLVEGAKGFDGWQLGNRDLQLVQMQLNGQPYLPQSYVLGATPENGYRLPDGPYRFAFAPNPYSGDPAAGEYKVFVVCSGAASPRPVTLRRDERGLWRAREWSSLLVGVQEPPPEGEGGL